LDQKIGAWTSQFTARKIMEKLQAAGARGGVVQTMSDLYDDPQLNHRGQWIELEHPEIGRMHYQRPPYNLTKSPAGPDERDPLLGEHNDYFYLELLGLSQKEYKELIKDGVID